MNVLGASYEPDGELTEKAVSQQQQKFFGMVRATQKGEMDNPSDEVKKAAASMTKSDVKKYASTKHDKLPKKIEEKLDSEDKPFVKKLVGKLRKGSKTHAKQADDLEKAMKENTAIESELLIQDWNKDDIKFTEIETVDIIKAKPLKESNDELDEKFKFLKHAFGKTVILGTGADKAMGKFPRLSSKGVKNLIKNKSQLAIQGFKGAVQKVKDLKGIDGPTKFPRDKQILKVKKKINPNAIFPTKANVKIKNEIISPDGISTKNPIKKIKKDIKDNYDWRTEIDEGMAGALVKGGIKSIPALRKGIPALMTGIGAAGTIMQSKKKETSDAEDEDRLFDLASEPFKNRNRESESPEVRKNRDRSERRLKEFIAKRKKTRELTKNKQNLEKSYEKSMDNDIKDHYDWRTEIDEDWQKVNRKDKTDGLSKAAVKAYRRENPGSKLQTAVTKDPKKLKKGSKSAKRRLSFCRRMKGMKKKLTSAKTRRDPDSRINKALRRWNC